MPVSQAEQRPPPDLAQPFVLIDDAGGDGRRPARFLDDPVAVVTADTRANIAAALDRMAALHRAGHWLAGFIGYEAGHALEPRLSKLAERAQAMPLIWMGAFRAARMVDPIDLLQPFAARPLSVEPPAPRLDAAGYATRIAAIQALIAAGDIYQANFTFPVDIRFQGHPLTLYARLRRTQRMAHGAVVWTGREWLLSASPELFFALRDGQLTARPMKGTAARRPGADEDEMDAQSLALDQKNRAENLMITDLIRNDLSRVAVAGSVTVRDAFKVERYPTVHQMTTSVSARLREALGPFDALSALFPCGSVTGAPKIRAMEVIDAVEAQPRGAYTGSIGWIDPDGEASFNVAIRTVRIDRDGTASMGVGSGIVADSDAAAEWEECRQKMAFVSELGRPFHLIETMAFDPAAGIQLLDHHFSRVERSARYHDMPFDRHEARNLLQAVVGALRIAARVKLTLGSGGAMAVAVAPMPPAPPLADVRVLPLPVGVDDRRLRHKTSDRAFYDDARRSAGCFEVLFERPDGHITEGSFTSVFVERSGRLLTPPESDGLLPGVLRQSLIDAGRAVEARLTRADLADGFLLGNAVRGLIAARLVD